MKHGPPSRAIVAPAQRKGTEKVGVFPKGLPMSDPTLNTQVYPHLGESQSPLLFSTLSLTELNGVIHVKKCQRMSEVAKTDC